MGELLIKNGRVIDPANSVDKECDVLIVDGNIVEVGKIEKTTGKTIFGGRTPTLGPWRLGITAQ